jgi:acetyl esterase
MIWFVNHYIRDEEDRYHGYAAPLNIKDLSNLPPAIVINAENDVLRDEGIAYAESLKESGVSVQSFTEPGMVHGFFANMVFFSNALTEAISKINQFLQKIKPVVPSK